MQPITLDGKQRERLLAVLIALKIAISATRVNWPKDAQAMLELVRDGK